MSIVGYEPEPDYRVMWHDEAVTVTVESPCRQELAVHFDDSVIVTVDDEQVASHVRLDPHPEGNDKYTYTFDVRLASGEPMIDDWDPDAIYSGPLLLFTPKDARRVYSHEPPMHTHTKTDYDTLLLLQSLMTHDVTKTYALYAASMFVRVPDYVALWFLINGMLEIPRDMFDRLAGDLQEHLEDVQTSIAEVRQRDDETSE